MRRYGVVGVGAIGGFYGARLADAGHEVHFVARSDTDHIRANGLGVESPLGDIHLDGVSVFSDAAEVPPVDVVVLAVKTTDTDVALPAVAEIARRSADVDIDPIVIVLQNGLGVEAQVAGALGRATVLGGMCFICSQKVGPGHIRHLDYGRVTVGEHRADGGAAGITPAVSAVVEDLAGTGVGAVGIEHLEAGRWRKLVWNIAYNGLSVLLDAGTDELMADTGTRALVEELMWEVVAGAAARGVVIEGDFVEAMLRDTETMIPYATSMKLDHDARRPLEIEAIYAAPIAVARAGGYEMARTETLYRALQLIDNGAR